MDNVQCRSDAEYAERPLVVRWKGERLEISEILASWRRPGAKAFRVRTAGGRLFELTYMEIQDHWEIQPL